MHLKIFSVWCICLTLAACEPAKQSDTSQNSPPRQGVAQAPDKSVPINDTPPVAGVAPQDEIPHSILSAVWPRLTTTRTGDLDSLLEAGEFRVLTKFSLTNYYIQGGVQRGVIYEAVNQMESYVKKHLSDSRARRLKFTIIPVREDQLLPFLQQGYGDLVFADLTITPERQRLVDFSEPYNQGVRELLVTRKGTRLLTDPSELSGAEVHVRKSASYYESLLNLNKKLLSENRPKVNIVLVDPRLEDGDVLELVHEGVVPATVIDDTKLPLWTRVFDRLQVNPQVVLRSDGEIALALRKNSPQLKKLLDKYAAEYRVGTLITNTLIKRYYGERRVVDTEQRSIFHGIDNLIHYFKKYGNRYEIDWLLLTAFAYQESRFDPDAISKSGAVGVMQVLPETASYIGIRDVAKIENNIHAGTKYLARLRDHYFNDENLSPLEQLLFTMAGYNAGPNRINRLRKLAAERGLDPNQWFNNVELVVEASVGREPVRYVANIYRYYIAYRLSLEDIERSAEAWENISS